MVYTHTNSVEIEYNSPFPCWCSCSIHTFSTHVNGENMNRMIWHRNYIMHGIKATIVELCKCKFKLVSAIFGMAGALERCTICCVCELVHMHLNLRFIITIMRLKRCVRACDYCSCWWWIKRSLLSSLFFFHCWNVDLNPWTSTTHAHRHRLPAIRAFALSFCSSLNKLYIMRFNN